MAGLSSYSRGSVILTYSAFFVLVASLSMSWYYISNGTIIVSEYWLDHFNPVQGSIDTYYQYEEMNNVMLGLRVFAVLWFLASLYYVIRIISDSPRSLVKEIAVGTLTISVGVLMITYFVLAFPSAAPSRYVSGFFSSVIVDRYFMYTGGPGGGFYACIFACVLQSLAVMLQVYHVYSTPRAPPLEPYEAPVGEPPPK